MRGNLSAGGISYSTCNIDGDLGLKYKGNSIMNAHFKRPAYRRLDLLGGNYRNSFVLEAGILGKYT